MTRMKMQQCSKFEMPSQGYAKKIIDMSRGNWFASSLHATICTSPEGWWYRWMILSETRNGSKEKTYKRKRNFSFHHGRIVLGHAHNSQRSEMGTKLGRIQRFIGAGLSRSTLSKNDELAHQSKRWESGNIAWWKNDCLDVLLRFSESDYSTRAYNLA